MTGWGVGFIGCGLIGLRHIEDFRKLPDANLAAVCDVYEPRMAQARELCGGAAKTCGDFRRLVEDKSVDAVVISTPDHWLALQTIMACAAGKDVYVEKPMTLFAHEGRWMIDAARRHKRVAWAGTQGRSNTLLPEALNLVRNGAVGRIHSVRFSVYRNIMPGFGRPADTAPPPGLDYDLWLGPAPQRPYNPHRCLCHFRRFWDCSGGQMTNLGAHDLDLAHYVPGPRTPRTAYSAGGRYAPQDDGVLVEGSFREAGGSRRATAGTASSLAGVHFIGSQGLLVVSRGAYEFVPDWKIEPEGAIPPWSNPAGHPQAAKIEPRPSAPPRHGKGASPEPIDRHARHFPDCVKSRKRPIADVEDGHEVPIACHLANLSMKLGRRLAWDPKKEEVIGDREANALLERPCRKPWDSVLRSLLA